MNPAYLFLAVGLVVSGIGIRASKASPALNGGGIVGLTDRKPAKITLSIFKTLDETETIEFLDRRKFKVTKNGVTFSGKYREADRSVTFKRSARGKAERFLKAEGVLIHEKSRDLYFDETALVLRKQFHRKVDEQLKSHRSISTSANLAP